MSVDSNSQLKEANMIEMLAQKALETSEEAYRLANKSINMPFDTQKEIADLRAE